MPAKIDDKQDLSVRRARQTDCEALTDLCFRSKQSNGYDRQFMEACREELTVSDETLRTSECWLAEVTHTLCGCACLRVNSETRTGEINLFFIAPEWQRQGVGKLLWQNLLQRAKYHQLNEILLDADPSAQPFYNKLGFAQIGWSASESIDDRFLPRMSYSQLSR